MQVAVTQEFGRNVRHFQAEQNKRKDALKAKLENGEIDQADYDEQISRIQKQSLLVNMVAGGLMVPSDSVLGVAASTLAPAASYEIGQYFKDLASQNANGQLSTSQELAHMLTHAALGAATAGANGGNAVTGAITSGGAEAAAPILSRVLYGENNPANLNAEQKETLTNIVALSVLPVGSNNFSDMFIAQTVALNAVNNNAVEMAYHKKEKKMYDDMLNICDGLIIPGGYRIYNFHEYLVCEAIKRDIPILGICMGMQLLANLDNQENCLVPNETEINHRQTGVKYVHKVRLLDDTKLKSIINKDEISVNSKHRYHVDKVKNFIISAYSEDGLIEGIEKADSTFVVGVQWHPEKMYTYDEDANKLLSEFRRQNLMKNLFNVLKENHRNEKEKENKFRKIFMTKYEDKDFINVKIFCSETYKINNEFSIKQIQNKIQI